MKVNKLDSILSVLVSLVVGVLIFNYSTFLGEANEMNHLDFELYLFSFPAY